jgi:hypothetical protein
MTNVIDVETLGRAVRPLLPSDPQRPEESPKKGD